MNNRNTGLHLCLQSRPEKGKLEDTSYTRLISAWVGTNSKAQFPTFVPPTWVSLSSWNAPQLKRIKAEASDLRRTGLWDSWSRIWYSKLARSFSRRLGARQICFRGLFEALMGRLLERDRQAAAKDFHAEWDEVLVRSSQIQGRLHRGRRINFPYLHNWCLWR